MLGKCKLVQWEVTKRLQSSARIPPLFLSPASSLSLSPVALIGCSNLHNINIHQHTPSTTKKSRNLTHDLRRYERIIGMQQNKALCRHWVFPNLLQGQCYVKYAGFRKHVHLKPSQVLMLNNAHSSSSTQKSPLLDHSTTQTSMCELFGMTRLNCHHHRCHHLLKLCLGSHLKFGFHLPDRRIWHSTFCI